MLKYAVITPCRDEAAFLEQMAESLLSQTVRPGAWIIVDDGSTDATPVIADKLQEQANVRAIHLQDRGNRAVGGGVVDAFNAGMNALDPREFDVICKLDADIVLPERYMEQLLERLDADPRLGSCSGKPYFVNDRRNLVSERIGDDVSVGASKVYRREALEDVGGLVSSVMWDGIDVHEMRRRGWRVASWDEPELRFVHLRPMGASDRGILRGRVRWGAGQHFLGTGPLWITASSTYRMTRPPVFVGGAAMLWGYLSSAVTGRPRYGDDEFRRFLRRFHRLSLVHGKTAATALVEREREADWNSRHEPGQRAKVDDGSS